MNSWTHINMDAPDGYYMYSPTVRGIYTHTTPAGLSRVVSKAHVNKM